MKFSRLLLFLLFLGAAADIASADPQLHARPRYAVRSGDSLAVEYRYTPEFNQTVIVQPDGFITLSLLGEMKVSGLTLAEVHDAIASKAALRLNKPELDVVLTQFERPYFMVAGEVDKPGRLDFYEHTTALEAVMLAGGFKETAQESQVIIFRRAGGGLDEVIPINLHKVRKNSDLERDRELQPGDIVLVPRNKLENVARFVKATNLGLYLDPLTFIGQ